ncbi:MAG: hypothetical protein ACJAV6_000618 [Candidatus Paceibacteria bacterium]|jgi:hypothetical protein
MTRCSSNRKILSVTVPFNGLVSNEMTAAAKHNRGKPTGKRKFKN